MGENDKLIPIFTCILQGLSTSIAMHHVTVAQQRVYVICAVEFLACSPMCAWSVVPQAGEQETWLEHGIERVAHKRRCIVFILHGRGSQPVENLTQAVCYFNHI